MFRASRRRIRLTRRQHSCRELHADWDALPALPRADSIDTMTATPASFLSVEHSQHQSVAGVVAVGGSCGTAICSSAFSQYLPLGMPKRIFSTVAASSMAAELI